VTDDHAAGTNAGVRSTLGAIWLAVAVLPLLPCFAVVLRLHPRGFDQAACRFRWPLWDRPLALSAIRTVLGPPEAFTPELSPVTLWSYGIAAVFEANRVSRGRDWLRSLSSGTLCSIVRVACFFLKGSGRWLHSPQTGERARG
jgi:hypothetical protein